MMVYDVKGKKNFKLLPDILKRVKIRSGLSASRFVFDKYNVKEGEKPEDIAFKYYGDAQYHWIIMLANDRFDYRSDFPLTQIAFEDYIADKYEDPEGIHHYEDANGVWVDSDATGAVSVSNRVYEDKVNESKRRIKIPSSQLIAKILKDFKNEM